VRGNPQAISSRLPRAAPSRRWSNRIADAIQGRRRQSAQRYAVSELAAREGRRASARGQYVPERPQRIRPW
jgi:hypothetical protein